MRIITLARLGFRHPLLAARYVVLRLLFPRKLAPENIKTVLWDILPVKTNSRHQEITLLRSIDHGTKISQRLVALTSQLVIEAGSINVNFLDQRASQKSDNPETASFIAGGGLYNIWPGEHYRLLSALVRVTKAKHIIEIGTFWGAGALALKAGLDSTPGGKVTTYDIVPWHSFKDTLFVKSDFDDGLDQVVGDLQDASFFKSQQALFEQADIIFMDAAKNAVMERRFLETFRHCKFRNNPILIIDDIHLWNMLDIWDEIQWPKVDISCFGHYTGTGLVDLRSDVVLD
jgi:predicted O-methyltransferase YrrM